MNYANKLIQNKIEGAPVDAGCYLYKNSEKKIIYIGKAKNIRNRVKSYFQHGKSIDPKTIKLVSKIADVEFIVTHSEVEALILENTLIKTHRPKYNILLRDDKTFPYVCITKENFPRVFTTRKQIPDGSKYLGPYTDSKNLKKTIRIIKRLFPVRSCKFKINDEKILEKKIKLCLDYHIHKCEGPCRGLINEKDYKLMIENIIAFLEGKTSEVIDFFKQKMQKASFAQNFETAAKYRDNIAILENYSKRQAVELSDMLDRDLINLIVEAENGCAVVFRIRQGKLIGKDSFFLEGVQDNELPEIMRNFIQQYYNKAEFIPQDILLNIRPDEDKLLREWLSNLRSGKVTITRPVRKNKLRLLKMAGKNARLQIDEYVFKKIERADYIPKTVSQLQKELSLPKLPRRIEAFDISNIKGKFAVGSLVTFINAKPKKSEYRRFKIKTVTGIDDFSMMAEVINRRYKRVLDERKPLPDLILIDGGKGQLSSAKSVLEKLDLDKIPVAGIAKKLEEIFLPNTSEPILLRRDSLALILLQRVRDESHRFAITYHRKLRGKASIKSQLDNIPGLGEKKKIALLKYYKTISKIKSVSVEELCLVEGIGPKLAQTVWTCLHERR